MTTTEYTPTEFLELYGVEENNLKDISLALPHNTFIVITGLSGSGKSSLAFQTIYAEGGRRYIETFSPYIRQFLDRLPRPKIRQIAGVRPALALEQRKSPGGSRSTVGTSTEINHYLKLIWSQLSQVRCASCHENVPNITPQSIIDYLLEKAAQFSEYCQSETGPSDNSRQTAALKTSKREKAKSLPATNLQHLHPSQPLPTTVFLMGFTIKRESNTPTTSLVETLLTAGFVRYFSTSQQAVKPLSEFATIEGSDSSEITTEEIIVILERFKASDLLGTDKPLVIRRLQNSIAEILAMGHGTITLVTVPQSPDTRSGNATAPVTPSIPKRKPNKLSKELSDNLPDPLPVVETIRLGIYCQQCDIAYTSPKPSLFSFNSPLGACPQCRGFGNVLTIDTSLAIPDTKLSIAQGAITCWNTNATSWEKEELLKCCSKYAIDINTPWHDLPSEHRDLILHGNEGTGKKAGKKKKDEFWGLSGWFKWLEGKRYKMHVRVFLSHYRKSETCPSCHGARLRPDALNYEVEGLTIAKFEQLPVLKALAVIDGIIAKTQNVNSNTVNTNKIEIHGVDASTDSVPQENVLCVPLTECRSRLAYLAKVGLPYLTLDRAMKTLSGGESQRVNLTSIIGANLSNTILILDEPTVGLHPTDTQLLINVIGDIRDQDNTVIVVEHDKEIIRAADHLVDLGPLSGARGGEIIFMGHPSQLVGQPNSLTAQYLDGLQTLDSSRTKDIPAQTRSTAKKKISSKQEHLEILGANAQNLKNIDIAIPVGKLVALTGVSGSGKSTFLEDCLLASWEAWQKHSSAVGDKAAANGSQPVAYPHIRKARGFELFDEVVLVDQSPLVRNPRSNPATYSGLWELIRNALSNTPDAQALGLSPSAFSFNVDGGRCPHCKGAGAQKVEMQFLSDVFVGCEQCGGERFQDSILSVQLAGHNVAQWLKTPLEDTLQILEGHIEDNVMAKATQAIDPFIQLGLGYLTLGQPLSELSGGEAQRVKLASYLSDKKSRSLLLLDEPTTGLHPYNVQQLVDCLYKLVGEGHSIVCIEHNLDLVYHSDWLIELGPGGGDAGGNLVACGNPMDLMAAARKSGKLLDTSPTLQALHSELTASVSVMTTGIGSEAAEERLAANYDGMIGITRSKGSTKIASVKSPAHPFAVPRIALAATEKSGIYHGNTAKEEPSANQGVTALERGYFPRGKVTPFQDHTPFQNQPSFQDHTPFQNQPSFQDHSPLQNQPVSASQKHNIVRPSIVKASQPHDHISIIGARHHNLKNVSVDIPKSAITCITGVSGSGKSTLAFDVLFAEGQRRFIDSLSPYARQFISSLERPDVERILSLSPTIAVSQKTAPPAGVSTVGTTSEVYQYLRLLYAKAGTQHCPVHKVPLSTGSAAELVDEIINSFAGQRIYLLAPVVEGRKGNYQTLLERAMKAELSEAIIDGEIVRLSEGLRLEKAKLHWISLVVSQLTCQARNRSLLLDAVQQTLALSGGSVEVAPLKLSNKLQVFSTKRICPKCKKGFRELDPQDFSFRSERGVCNKCHGKGVTERKTTSPRTASQTADQVGSPCRECGGTRLSRIGRSVFIDDHNIWQLSSMSAPDLLQYLTQLDFPSHLLPVTEPILHEIISRLKVLNELGLSYISLDREASNISGGEAQRLRLAKTLGAPLSGVCYVFDEPTIGLHPSDHSLVMNSLRQLRAQGNTVVVVEHDEDTIRSADYLIDLGPGGGANGGEIVASGTVAEVIANPASPTGRCLSERDTYIARGIANDISTASAAPKPRRSTKKQEANDSSWLTISGARTNNLQELDVSFLVGGLNVVAGVSGAGKSSLVKGTLVPLMEGQLSKEKKRKAMLGNLSGGELFTKLIEIDQSPIGRTTSSVPASFLGIYDEIRKLFASLPDAKTRGYTASFFSFNSGAGKCASCSGKGFIKVPMSFLPDAVTVCEECSGLRFNDRSEQVKFKGLSIGNVLKLTVSQAKDVFSHHRKIHQSLDLVNRLGLGYMTLGQPTFTLSGGEAQRLKIACELATSKTKDVLYILDEPTVGLHMSDVDKLLHMLRSLVSNGNTVVVIEHDLAVIRAADHLIEVGPAGGAAGGRLLFSGQPNALIKSKRNTPTAQALRHR